MLLLHQLLLVMLLTVVMLLREARGIARQPEGHKKLRQFYLISKIKTLLPAVLLLELLVLLLLMSCHGPALLLLLLLPQSILGKLVRKHGDPADETVKSLKIRAVLGK